MFPSGNRCSGTQRTPTRELHAAYLSDMPPKNPNISTRAGTQEEGKQERLLNGQTGGKVPRPAEDAALLTDWREQPIRVQGRPMTYADMSGGKLFHGSKADLPVGTVLTPGGGERNFTQSAEDAVSITSDRARAEHWAAETAADSEPVFVYEVEPVGDIDGWRLGLAERGTKFHLWEGRVPAARIIGRA